MGAGTVLYMLKHNCRGLSSSPFRAAPEWRSCSFSVKDKGKKTQNNNNNKNGKQITPYITNEQCIALFTGKAMCCSVWSDARHRIWFIAVSTFICKRKSNMPEWVCICLQWFFSLLLFPLLKTLKQNKFTAKVLPILQFIVVLYITSNVFEWFEQMSQLCTVCVYLCVLASIGWSIALF